MEAIGRGRGDPAPRRTQHSRMRRRPGGALGSTMLIMETGAAACLSIPGRRRGTFPAQEAFPAKDRTPLSRLEGNRGFPAALRTGGHGFRFGKAPGSRTLTLVLADLAALGFIFEVLVVEEVLFSRCEYEICPAVCTLEDAVLKLRHINVAP